MVFIIIPKIYSKYTLHTSFNNWEPIKMSQNDFELNEYFFFSFNTTKIYYLIKNTNFHIINDYFISYYDNFICNYTEEINNSFNNIIYILNAETMKIVENDSILFDGFCLNNLPNGFGIIFNNGKILFEGLFKNGVKHGKGIEYFNNEVLYKGEFKNSLFHGIGILYNKKKKFYEGEFKNNKYHGEGTLYVKGKIDYRGDFENDLCHGEGTKYINEKKFYEGEFSNNSYFGEGKFYQDQKSRHFLCQI